jgi:predicted amidohydrolase YtcJ
MSKPAADWLLFNGKIHTVDSKDSIAEAILIKDGKIQQVGSSEEIRRLAPDPVQELDLEGRTVTPGFIDCHNHTVAYGFSLLGRDISRYREYPVEDMEKALLKAQEGLFKVGVTAQKEAGASDEMIRAYQNLHGKGELRLRSFLLIGIHLGRTSVELAREVVKKYSTGGDDTLTLGGVKCSFDGSASKRGPWLYEEWNKNYTEKDELHFGGLIVPEPQRHGEVVKILHRAGFQVCTHVHGDQAIDRYVDEIEAAIIDAPRTDSRHSVAHCTLPTDYALRKLVKLGDNVVVEASAAYLYFLGDLFAGNFGPNRSRRLIPFRTWFERGIMVGNGADYEACDVNPMYGLYAACTRRPRKGEYGSQPFGEDECLTIQQALRLCTINSAYCMFWEDQVGSLEPGKYADLVVWSGNLYDLPYEELPNQKVEMTMVNGEIVYSTDT